MDKHLAAPGERGSALVAVLLLLMMMTALASILAVSGRTETLMARNHETAAQARLAAEAGINHASQVVIAWLRQWPNTYADVNTALDALLQNHATLLASDIAFDTEVSVNGSDEIKYTVSLLDEDDDARAGGAQTTITGNNENGDEDNDGNKYLIIRAVGTGPNSTEAELEGVIGPYALPAIITDGDLTLNGNLSVVAKANGGVHANGNLSLSGSSLVVVGTPDLTDGTVTATGTYSASGAPVITGTHGGGVKKKEVPAIDADDYRSWANYILTTDGRITNLAGTTAYCDTSNGASQNACKSVGALHTNYGWRFTSSNGWDLDSAGAAVGGVFFHEGTDTLSVSASPGSALIPLKISLISRGSINISGSPHIAPANAEVLFVTEGDLKATGNLQIHANTTTIPAINEGGIMVHEQLQLGGSTVILGQIIVEDAAHSSSLVTTSSIGGNVTLIYNGDVGETIFHLAGWRQVR